MKRKTIITGGAGFIGSHLCKELHKTNEVICIDNLVEGKVDNIIELIGNYGFTFVEKSVYDKSILPYFKGVDVVFHNAASKCLVCLDDPYEDLMTNSRGSWCVFEASRLMGVRKVVYASTGSVNDGNPKSFYGVTKYSAEKYLNAFKCYYPDFNYSILRYYHIYGTHQTLLGVIPTFITNILNNKPIIIQGTGEQERRFTYVGDVVKANQLVSTIKECSVYNVVSDFTISIKDLAYLIYDLMGRKPDIVHVEARPDDVMRFNDVSNDKLKELGMVFDNNFEDRLKEVIKWYYEKNEKR